MLVAAELDNHPGTLREALNNVARVLRLLTWGGSFFLLACLAIGVAYRAAGCVVREKQDRTLDLLLQIPVDRADILWAKWRGALFKGKWWYVLLLADLLIAALLGAFDPQELLWLLIGSHLLVFLVCSVGVLISVAARTRLQANMVMAVILLGIALTGAAWAETGRNLPRDLSVLAFFVTVTAVSLASLCIYGAASMLFERTGR
jgi:ABC-type Na+ efflux pump permease subunit